MGTTQHKDAYEVLDELLVCGADVLPLIALSTEYAIGVESVGTAAGDVGYRPEWTQFAMFVDTRSSSNLKCDRERHAKVRCGLTHLGSMNSGGMASILLPGRTAKLTTAVPSIMERGG